jgi:hypothetical protein
MRAGDHLAAECLPGAVFTGAHENPFPEWWTLMLREDRYVPSRPLYVKRVTTGV